RSAQSATADYRATLAEHANSWKDKKAVLEDEIEDYREKLGLTGRRRANQDATRPNDEEQRKLWTTAMEKKQDELADLQRDEVKDRRKLERGKWKSLRDRAEGAEYRAASGGYWRQSGFILGTMLLTLGLLVLAFIGDPGERKVCLVLITIIVFSLFVAGKAWGESVSSTLRDLIPANRR
ncbi:MAG: hypothetical protein KF777_25330, partial [Planctomycetaceae bacterium]|nr:hypothetical protein [Planctomycetaceae bacterium]